MKYLRHGIAVALVLVSAAACHKQAAQQPAAKTGFDPLKAFAPLTLPDTANAYRSADGTPGPLFWQNRADYTLHATLDPIANVLRADEVITYTNNSPTALDYVWVQLDQNIYRKDSRARTATVKPTPGSTEGFVLDEVEVGAMGALAATIPVISDTRMQIRLAQPLAAKGGKLTIHIGYHFTIPGAFGGRIQHAKTKNGEVYDIAQWYPRMCVYDDLRGWDTQPYLGSEFYLDYGDIDYSINVPADMIVAGGGELQNPDEVLTPLQQQRLAQARVSDTTVMIRRPTEVNDPTSRPTPSGALTWHFKMNQTRDVAFSASRAFVWDAARINLPEGKTALAMSVYPAEFGGYMAWGRGTEYLKDSVEDYSKRWFAYPWPTAVNVGGPVGGMEYPGMAFDDMTIGGKELFWITAHEIGHSWFPMIVGSNERRDPWIDEGFNTFIDTYESDDFEHGVFGPKKDSEYAPGKPGPADQMAALLGNKAFPGIMLEGDQVPGALRHEISYFKPAFGLRLLREQILGPDRFDYAFRKFVRDWAYHHPTPSDFFRAMNSAAGEDLSWFWRGWFFNNWTFDLAVTDVKAAKDGKSTAITIANNDALVLPATVEIRFADGTARRVTLPVETWLRKTSTDLVIDTTARVTGVTIDPDHALPDRDRTNNVWRAN